MEKYIITLLIVLFYACSSDPEKAKIYADFPYLEKQNNASIKIEEINSDFKPLTKLPIGYLSVETDSKKCNFTVHDKQARYLYKIEKQLKSPINISYNGYLFDFPRGNETPKKIKKYSFGKIFKEKEIDVIYIGKEIFKNDTIKKFNPNTREINSEVIDVLKEVKTDLISIYIEPTKDNDNYIFEYEDKDLLIRGKQLADNRIFNLFYKYYLYSSPVIKQKKYKNVAIDSLTTNYLFYKNKIKYLTLTLNKSKTEFKFKDDVFKIYKNENDTLLFSIGNKVYRACHN